MREVFKGATSQTIYLVLRSSTTGLGLTAKVFGDVTGSYTRMRAARTAITMATLASASAAYSSGGFILVDDTNCPGLYRFDIPDAAFATGADRVVVSVKVTGAIEEHIEFVLIDINKQVAFVPNAAAGATGGLDCKVVQGGTAQAGAAGSITLAAGASATNDLYKGEAVAITAGVGAGQVRQITAYNGTTKVATVDWNWTTTPDNTSIYEVHAESFAPMNSSLKVLGVVLTDTVTTYTGNTPQTGDNFARLGAPVGASISADIAGVQSDTNDIQTRLPAALVSGRMDSSVGAMAANVLTATAINADAFTAAKFAADVTTELQAGLATAAALATVQADTDDIQTRLPAALVSGRIDASVGAMAANVLTATAINADAITAAKVAADVTTELQAGLATAASISALNNLSSAQVTAAVPTAIQNADALLDRNMATGTDSGSPTVRTPRQALRFLRNKWSSAAGVVTVTKEDDTTASWTTTVATDAAADPIISSDPA